MRKLIIIFMLLGVTLNAQLYQIPQRISSLSDVTIPSATHTQSGSDYLDSLLLTHADGEGFLPIKVDSLTGTSNITFPADVEQLADSNRFFTNSNGWIINGDGDTTISPSDSSIVIYDSAGASFELPINLTEDQGYELTVDLVEGEEDIMVSGDLSSSTGWTFTTGSSIVEETLVLDFDVGANCWAKTVPSEGADSGATYILKYDIISYTANNKLYLSTTTGSFNSASLDIPYGIGANTFSFVADDPSGVRLMFRSLSSSGSAVLDDIKLFKVSPSQSVESSTITATYGNQTLFTSDTITSITQSISQRFIATSQDPSDWYEFDGVDDYINTNDTYESVFQSSFSIEVQATPTDGRPSAGQFLYGELVSTAQDYVGLYINTDGTLIGKYYANNVDNTTVTSSVVFSDGQAQETNMIMVVNDEVDSLKIYADGVLVGGGSMLGVMGDYANTTLMSVGARTFGTTKQNFFGGDIGAFRIYNKALTSTEVTTLYGGGSVSGAVLDLNGDSTHVTDGTWYDASGNDNDGTVTGATPNYNPKFTFTLSDTSKVNISNLSLKSLNDYRRINYGDSIYAWYYKDIDSVATFNEKIYAHYNGKTDSTDRSYEVTYPHYLTMEVDTLDLDTVTTSESYVINYFSVFNYSPETITIVSDSGISPPFYIDTHSASVGAGGSVQYACTFNPNTFGNGDYVDTLHIKTVDSTYQVVFIGTKTSGSTIVLTQPTIIATPITSGDGGILLTSSYIDDADGYKFYYEPSDVSGYKLLETTTSTTTTFNRDDADFRELLEFNFKVVAYKSTTNSTASDVVSETSTPVGNYATLDSTGAGTYTTISGVNDSLNVDYDLYIKSGHQFNDETFIAKAGSYISTYGGTTKAILGDSTLSKGTTQYLTISVGTAASTYEENILPVTIQNLEISGYDSTQQAIGFYMGNVTIKDCIIHGGKAFYRVSDNTGMVKKYNDITTPITITRNVIRDFQRGISFTNPDSIEISYNTMYNFYMYGGLQNVGGVGLRGMTSSDLKPLGTPFDTEYTFHVHHNNIYQFEHSAMYVGQLSNALIENNYIHDNLDERVYFGGIKHGTVGKFFDNTGYLQPNCPTGNIFRYNYVYNLKRRGLPGYVYTRPDLTQFLAEEVQEDYTGVYEGPVYQLSETDTDPFGDEDGEGPDGVISGLGFGGFWVHNNIFNNIGGAIVVKGSSQYVTSTGLGGLEGSLTTITKDEEIGSYFVNNTLLNVANQQHGINHGAISQYTNSQSPMSSYNNIIDITNPALRYASEWLDSHVDANSDYNIYVNQTGTDIVTTTMTSDSAQKARMYRYGASNESGTNEYDLTDADFVDTSSTIRIYTIGTDSIDIPDVRITESSNSYGTGKPYSEIGDTYTVNGITHVMGQDPTGVSFAVDIVGNETDSTRIGAVGLGESASVVLQITPLITLQPVDVSDTIGATVQFTVNATCDFPITYQWWKIDPTTWEIVDGDSTKYEGATSRTLTIKDIQESENGTRYAVEVKNSSIYPTDGSWVNSSRVYLYVSEIPIGSSDTDTLTIVNATDDGYYKASDGNLYSVETSRDWLDIGYNSGNVTAGFIFTGMEDWETITSATLYFSAYNDYSVRLNTIIKGEDVNSPATFSNAANFISRIDTVTDASVAYLVDATTLWEASDTNSVDITSIIQELDASYEYTNGTVGIYIFNNTSAARRLINSQEQGNPAYIIITGTK